MELQRAGNEGRFRALKLLLDEGAPLLLGTDAPNPFVIPGFSIHEELANLVRAEFSPFQALRCGTSEAARFMDEADEWGTIATGRRADLLLLSANPLERVEVVARPEAVFVNGFYLTRDQLDALLEERAASVGAKLAPLELSALPVGAIRVSEGKLQNSYGGRINGFMTFRCCRVEGGGWLVEERRNGGPGQEAARRMWLGADFTVERIVDRYPTQVGEGSYGSCPVKCGLLARWFPSMCLLGCLNQVRSRQRFGDRYGAELGHGLGAEVATGNLPLIVLLGQNGADQTHDSAVVGEDAHHVGTTLDLLVQTFLGVVGPDLAPVVLWERQIRQHLLLGFVQQLRHAWEAGPELIGDPTPLLARTGSIRLDEDGADCGGDHLLGALGHQAQCVSHEMGSAALPTGALEHRGNRTLESLVAVAGH